MPRSAAFYFDLGSPAAYLAAERVLRVVPQPCEWQPVLASRLAGAETYEAYRCATEQEIARQEFERRAAAAGLQAVRWPHPFPFDSEFAMLAATYAKQIGRAVPFAQAAFRQAFAGGHALSSRDHVLLAAAACEMHPRALLRAAESRGVRAALESATADATRLGVTDVPAVRIGATVLVGEHRLDEAAALVA